MLTLKIHGQYVLFNCFVNIKVLSLPKLYPQPLKAVGALLKHIESGVGS